jgi:hypothetical protein
MYVMLPKWCGRFIQEILIGEKFIANAGAISIKSLFDQVAQRFNKKGPSIKLNRSIVMLAAIAEELQVPLNR